jgi:GntR family transcriptional regulator, carbon starvation induced regulator
MDTRPGRSASAQHRAYESIREDLLAGDFEPGEKLRIDDVSDRYGVGLSPMREALSRLSESGLIVALPQRGYRVASISGGEYADLVDMRLRLEPDALRDSIANGDIDWEARVAAGYQRLASVQRNMKNGSADGIRSWAQEDRHFHAALISNCASPWMLNFCRTVHEQTARYHRTRILEGIAPAKNTEDEHRALMLAALDRDGERAASLLIDHIRSVAKRIRAALESTVAQHQEFRL